MESPEKVIGKECRVFNCPKDNDECPVIDLGMKKNQCETSLLAKGGKSIATFKTVIPITLDNEDVLLEAFSDITEIKETEKALKISEQNFREANAMKDKLFSIIAHDLRNAFTIVLTGSYLLAEQIDHFEKAKVVKYAKNMHESAEKIDKLLENLLTWSRLQMNAIKMNPARLNIAEVVRQNTNLFHEYANQKEITMNRSIRDDILAYADQDMVNTVLRNLINNALKFSHAGGTVHVFTANEDENLIEIGVSDNGVGIEAEYCDQVFNIDSKFKEKGTAGETGNGLGLPLCKEFIEKNGGEIRVESEVGKGSTFKFTLPKFKDKK
jgi:signal transduction histidine kinase